MRLQPSRLALALCLTCLAAPALAGNVNLWSFPSPADTQKQGFLRITNPAAVEAEIEVFGIDDKGSFSGPVSFKVPAGQSRQITSKDLKDGNSAKGLTGTLATPDGEWQLDVYSLEDIVVSGYVRTNDGYVTSIHDTVGENGVSIVVPMFNPASNADQVSELRLVNPQAISLVAEIVGTDDAGQAGQSKIKVSLPAFGAVRLTAAQLESGTGNTAITEGKLGAGSGKWRLNVTAGAEIRVISLLKSPQGYVSNISTVAERFEGPIPTCADLNGAAVFSQEPRPAYLGFLGAAAGDSINNTGGEFGSSTGAKSVRNTNGEYGSATGTFSAQNPWTDTPPLIVRNGRILGALTSSLFYSKYRRISLTALAQSCELTATARQGF